MVQYPTFIYFHYFVARFTTKTEYDRNIESSRFLPIEEQVRRITDPVTNKRIKFPLYCLGAFWERSTIKNILSDTDTVSKGYFLHPVTGCQVSSRIVIDSFAPTANSYIHGVKLRLPPPDDKTDDDSEEEPATHDTAAAKNSNKAPLSLRKTFPVILHTDREGQVILTNI